MRNFLLGGFKLNLNNLLKSHIVGYSLRKKVCNEMFDNVDIMRHIFSIDINHLDFFYYSIILLSMFYYVKDIQYKSSFNNLESNSDIKNIIKFFEMLLFILILIMVKNVDSAT